MSRAKRRAETAPRTTVPLADLQRQFQAFLTGSDVAIRAQVVDAGKARADERLAVYAHAYYARLVEALGSDYEGLRALIGAERFFDIGRAYAVAFPSRHPSIRWFGGGLAEFLHGDPQYRVQPELAEMAAFEWALSLAVDAADTPLLTEQEVAALAPAAWPGMRLHFHPAVARLDLHWNVPEIYSAVIDAAALPSATRSQVPVAWLVWRRDIKSYFRSLAVDEAFALDAMRAGGDFSALCAGLCEWLDAQNVALHAAGLLKGWIADGMVIGLEAGASPPATGELRQIRRPRR